MDFNGPKYEDHHFIDTTRLVWNYSLFREEIIKQFQEGKLYNAYTFFGNKQCTVLGRSGTYFAVWAPNATSVTVKGNFNDWQNDTHPLFVRLDQSGIWEGFIPDIGRGEIYKYHIIGYQGRELDKGDPYAHFWERKPKTASITWNLEYAWNDAEWMANRAGNNALNAPISIYEVHLPSWERPDRSNEESYLTYEQLADQLVPYVKDMGFTHVEFMPVMEFPFDGSWGYQGTGYFAPSSRFGNPEGLMELINRFHTQGIGVILDWVPSHFPYDAHGLFMFDGAHTYEYADLRKGYHPDWNSYIFNYERGEVRSFLISNARFWFDLFHIDGIRVDAVSSMLRLDYSRKHGEWEPNEFGGNGNLEAIEFIKALNETIYRDFPDVQTIAEEATDWPGVSRPTWLNGLGFGMKWMMGWMHDTLRYFKQDPLYRSYQQDQFTFSMMYFYDENFMLPLSHDEVVHGKSPMLYKMPGDEWQKFANLRLLYLYMFTHPGAKLLFMGNEFGQSSEWNYKAALDWHLLQYEPHAKLQFFVKTLCRMYASTPALYEKQFQPDGFEWIDLESRQEAVITFCRKGIDPSGDVIIILNMTPVVRDSWKIRISDPGPWQEFLNSNDQTFGGSGDVFNPVIRIEKHDAGYILQLNLPPLGGVVLNKQVTYVPAH
jgi:1,4-alpha-glucan branching enzyme